MLMHNTKSLDAVCVYVVGYRGVLQGNDFDSASGLLGSTMKRLGLMSKAGHHNWMCYMLVFILFVVFIVYYLIR